MVKKNLKNALAAHQEKKAVKAHEEKVKEAQKAKEASIKASASGSKKRAKQLGRAAASLGGRHGTASNGSTDGKAELATEGVAASTEAGPSTAVSNEGTRRSTYPFQPQDTILLLGEGDFSFTLSLLSPPHNHSARRILATSFESSLEQCSAKYPKAKQNVEAIRALAGGRQDSVRFGVDAGDLMRDKIIRRWVSETGGGFTKVWFGFPHVGAGHKDEARNVLANQVLLLRCMVSVASVLKRGGRRPKYATVPGHGGKAAGKRKREEQDGGEEDDVNAYGPDLYADPVTESEEDDADELTAIERGPSSSSTARWPPRSPPITGSLLITLRNVKPYTLWCLPQLATHLPSMLPRTLAAAPALPKGMKAPTLADVERGLPQPSSSSVGLKVVGGGGAGGKVSAQPAKIKSKERGYDVWRSFAFHPKEWQGYRHVRTVGGGLDGRDRTGGKGIEHDEEGGGEGGSTGTDLLTKTEGSAECRTWELGLRE